MLPDKIIKRRAQNSIISNRMWVVTVKSGLLALLTGSALLHPSLLMAASPCGLPPGANDAMLRDTMSRWIGRCAHGSDQPPPPPVLISSYSDVTVSDYNTEWIDLLRNDGITLGCDASNTLYCPKDPVTKAQAAKLILRAEHGGAYDPPVAMEPAPYTDVPLSHPDVDWIAQAKVEGITTGCDATNYCPNEVLTQKGFLNMLSGVF